MGDSRDGQCGSGLGLIYGDVWLGEVEYVVGVERLSCPDKSYQTCRGSVSAEDSRFMKI